MERKTRQTVVALKRLTKEGKLNSEQIMALQDAIEILREYDNEINLKKATIDNVGNLYQFNAKTEYGEGWNAAVRGVLALLDPMQTRYKKGVSA